MTQHLVKPQFGPIREVLVAVEEAHRILVAAARAVEVQLSQLSDETWGIQAKRVQVDVEGRKQPLGEVINQCATIERLIDALRWVGEQSPEATVIECHPTTSDGTNDLVVRLPDESILRFEVSDVIDPRDSNRKEDKDLQSLRDALLGAPVAQRSFLVTSDSLGERILGRKQSGRVKKPNRPTEYRKIHSSSAGTLILEVIFSAPEETSV